MQEKIVQALAGAVVGGVLTWTAQALTLTGRVTAIEQSLMRIEARLYSADGPTRGTP